MQDVVMVLSLREQKIKIVDCEPRALWLYHSLTHLS